MSLSQYLLESSFCLAIFYGFYHIFLRKETFFQLNRLFLVISPLLALSIPLFNISFQEKASPEGFEAFLYPAIQHANTLNEIVWEQMRAPSPVFSLSVADIMMAIYLLGVFFMSFTLLRKLWGLISLIRKGKKQKNKDFTLIKTNVNFPAASFFSYIFWNQEITPQQQLILEHEKVHIRQWHSVDVLLMEFCVIIKWFNPLIYWFRTALKTTHEFIADQYVIQQKSNIRDYATLLVKQQKQFAVQLLTNTFYSLTKKRLKMMLQKPSKKVNFFKYLLVIPLIMSLMLLFSFDLFQELPKVKAGLNEIDAIFSDLGERTVFEIENPIESEIVEKQKAQFDKAESKYQIHIGRQTFPVFALQEFKNNFSMTILPQDLLSTALENGQISISMEGKKIELDSIEFIKPNGDYSSHISENEKGEKVIMESYNILPTVLKTSKDKEFKIPNTLIDLFMGIIEPSYMVSFRAKGKEVDFFTVFRLQPISKGTTEKKLPKTPSSSLINNHKLKLVWGSIEMAIWHEDNPFVHGMPFKYLNCIY